MKAKKIKPGAGMVLEANKPKPRHGERAALVRKLKSRYPELSTGEIARRAGCSWQSAKSVLQRFLGPHSEDDLRDFQQNQADVFDALKYQCLESVTPAKLRKTSAPGLVTAAAILHDKSQLLRGQATSINVVALMDVADLIRSKA